MNHAIFKYQVLVDQNFTLEMPEGAKILDVQLIGGLPYMWALVNPVNKKEERYFWFIATGQDFNLLENMKFIKTVIIGGRSVLVFHLFEIF